MFKYVVVIIIECGMMMSAIATRAADVQQLAVKSYKIQDLDKEQFVEQRKERIRNVFNKLNKDTIAILDDFYHPELRFQDPLGQIVGLPAMKAYYQNMYKNVKSIRFEFKNILQDRSEYIAFWKMYLIAPGLNGGEEFSVEGNSHIQFDEKTDLVIYHRDYFDMGDFIYERIPVLKNLIHIIKKKLAH